MDFEKCYLNGLETIVLSSLRLKKRFRLSHSPQIQEKLLKYGLICRNYSPQKNEIGEYIPDGTFSVSEHGREFFIYLRIQFRRSLLCPIVVAVISSAITAAITAAVTAIITLRLTGQP